MESYVQKFKNIVNVKDFDRFAKIHTSWYPHEAKESINEKRENCVRIFIDVYK